MGIASYSLFSLPKNILFDRCFPSNIWFVQIILEVFRYYCWREEKVTRKYGLDAERKSDSTRRTQDAMPLSEGETQLGFQGWKAFARDFDLFPLVRECRKQDRWLDQISRIFLCEYTRCYFQWQLHNSARASVEK